MNYNITLFVIIGILFILLVAFKRESLTLTDRAPWIPKKTPMPAVVTLKMSQDPELERSVDPGAHLECQDQCSTKGLNKEFTQACIDICLQKKWMGKE